MRRVLIIDDNADLRHILELSLELTADIEVATAASGPEGVQMARRDPPDAILLDVRMPGTDGPATLELLRRDPVTAEIPVLFVTASVQASERHHYEQLGVAGIVEKPFDPTTVGRHVTSLLGWI